MGKNGEKRIIWDIDNITKMFISLLNMPFMYDNMHANYSYVYTNVYSKTYSSEILLNVICIQKIHSFNAFQGKGTQWSFHSFEWTLAYKFMNIHVVFCFLLQSSEE